MYGFYPTHSYHLLALLVPLLLWLMTLPTAKRRHITILHTSSLAVSYWEEAFFRGLIFGISLQAMRSFLLATAISSILFGLFHLRNLWWAPRKQVVVNCLYTGLIFGPLLCAIRWWTGDIYFGIVTHALHNFISTKFASKVPKPTDEYLRNQQHKMNWFEYVFSGFWLLR